MPSILSHAIAPLAVGLALGRRRIPLPLLLAGALAAALPDMDVLAFKLGIAYGNSWGHRGASHSITFALLLGILAALFASRLTSTRLKAGLFVGLATLSHPLLDMVTNGGMGVALFWPYSDHRFFAPWQVIEVAPLRLDRIFSTRGLTVLYSEFCWIWLPSTLLLVGARIWQRLRHQVITKPAHDE